MSTERNKRTGWGCIVLSALALTMVVALLVAACGLVLAIRGYELPYGPGVAVLDVEGELYDERPLLAQLETLVGNPNTKALVLRVDSPGGVISVVEEVYNAIKKAGEENEMPIVASMGPTAASGGYYVCLAADHIFANKSSLTGSLGVLLEYSSAAELLARIGVKFEQITSGEFKGAGSLAAPLTERQRAHFEELVADYHDIFVEAVENSRQMPRQEVLSIADGRVFTGRQALKLNLIDEIGGLDEAVRYAAERAGIQGEPRIIRKGREPMSLLSMLERLGVPAGKGRLSRGALVPKYLLR